MKKLGYYSFMLDVICIDDGDQSTVYYPGHNGYKDYGFDSVYFDKDCEFTVWGYLFDDLRQCSKEDRKRFGKALARHIAVTR